MTLFGFPGVRGDEPSAQPGGGTVAAGGVMPTCIQKHSPEQDHLTGVSVMKELRAIVEAFEQARSDGKATALATVVGVSGSAYRRPGARMLITEEGQTTGAVSGGCLERDVILRAQRVIERGETTLATYDTTDEDDLVFGVGLGCRGVIRILIEPLPRGSEPCHLPLPEELLRRRETGVLATVWRVDGQLEARAGSRLLLTRTGRLWNDMGDPELAARIEADAREALRTLRSAARVYRLAAGHAEVFLELLRPPVPLVIFGGGPDAVPLVRLAGELGWHVTVVDGRPAAASRARFPRADAVVACRPEQARDQVLLDGDTVAVMMTHNYLSDLRLLELLLPSPVRYLGLLGPKSRSERLLQDLAQSGKAATAAQRGRLYAPVGLDLGAETSEEIALAILAEIRAVLAGHAGGPLRDRQAPIHERTQPEERLEWETLAVAESALCAASAS
jgi:xanthine dehydrogenase accessory factor